MKRLVVSLSVLAVLFSVVYAADIKPVYINVNSVDSLSSCNSEESHDRYYYIPSGKNVTIYPDDTYWNSNDAFIRKDSSVEIYSHGIISQCNTWERISNIVRGGGSTPKKYPALIFRNSDGCVLSKPTYTKTNNPTAIDAQIHYTVKFNLIGGGAGVGKGKNSGIFFYKDGDGKYACYPNWNTVSSASSCTSSSAYYRTDPNKHVGECLNYRVFRCGDGLINRVDGDTHYANGTYTEECDPENSSWKNRTDGKICNASCKIVEPKVDPVCNSTYHNQTKYTSTSAAWLSSSDDLCSKGKVKNFKDSGKPRVFTWDCENDGTTKTCTAKQQWCGDGEVNRDEKCDPENSSWKNRTDGKTCNASCEIVEPKVDPVCNSTYHNQTKYTSTSASWLSSSDDLCSKGKVKNFKDSGEPRVFTWDCENDGTTKTCTANQQWCGDGVRNGGEQCDYKDSTEENWGNDGCDTSCKQKIVSSSGCNDTFYYTLRYGWKYTFYDKFVPTATRYLYDFDVDFKEKTPYDYNQGQNPSFKWMDDLGNGIYKKVSTTRRVIQSNPSYLIKIHPDARSKDDLYIEYNIKYADKAYSSKPDDSKLKTHKECAYYAISWCGDGIIDTDWEGKRPEDKAEECDPGSAGTSVLPDGRICNSECKIESPKGTAVIEKTLKDKIEVTHTGQELIWEVKVTASGGNVTNFEIWDKMPVELEPNGTSWWNLDKTKSQNGIDVKYSNRKPNPKSSGNVNIHYWDVTGTLNQGKSITMLVKTKVKKMPGSGKNIVNIACVIKDNKEIDCDDDQPPKTEGYLVPVKTLIGTKEVKKTGDIIKWSLKVTAKGGDVENPIIIDKLPPVLTYRIFEVKHSEGFIIPQTPELSTFQSGGETWTKIVWNTIGTLKENDNIEFEVITYANKMPEKDYNNVLCARPKDKPSDEKCDEKEIPAPKLWIKKYIMDGTNKIKEKTVKIGDEIVYRIEFGNKGTASATITSIKDFLPKNVGYRSSEVYVGGIKVNTEVVENIQKGELSLITNKYKVVDGVHIDIFGGLTLAPNTEGYIIIKGEILSGNQDNRTNFACIYLNDKKPDDDIVDGPRCDDAVHNIDTGSGLICSKEDFKINTTSFTNAGGSTAVYCGTSPKGEKADTISINCGNGITYTGKNIASLSGTCTYPANSSSNSAYYNIQCKVNDKDSSDCKGTVTVPGQTTPPCFPAGTKVAMADGTKKNIEEVKEGDIVLSYNTDTDASEGNVVTKRIVHEDSVHEMYELTINGEVLKVTDAHRFYVRKSASSKEYGWIEAKNLKVRDILLMSDGSLAEIEKINHYPNKETVYNLTVENNHNYYVAEGYLVHNSKGSDDPYCKAPVLEGSVFTCTSTEKVYAIGIDCDHVEGKANIDKEQKGKDGDREVLSVSASCSTNNKVQCYVKKNSSSEWETLPSTCGWSPTTPGGHTPDTPGGGTTTTNPIYNSTNCADVNANELSYEQGEILPFYWNIENLTGGVGEWAYELPGGYLDPETSDPESVINKYKGTGCKGEEGRIALNSMVCYFDIIDPEGTPVRTKKAPCLQKESTPIKYSLLNEWMTAGKERILKNSDRGKSFYRSYEAKDTEYDLRSNLNYIKNFGENLTLFGEYKVKLSQISYLQCKNDATWIREDISGNCETPFVLTNPYTVQKTPSGNLKASTETLSRYMYCKKYKKRDNSKELPECENQKYASAADLLNAISRSAYNPNKAVDNAMENFIKKYEKLAVKVSVKKGSFLEGKDIRKVPGKNIYFVKGDITIKGGSKDITSPFTIVQLEGNATINGNEGHNMMLLTKHDITFVGNCTSDQTVRGIFYAGGSLKRQKKYRNDNLDSGTWCTNGGLHVKGVLIGNEFNKLMDYSRSNLNDRFNVSGNDNEIENQRRGYVMNGASVVIEYSPSVFTKGTMPPGAEDFTTALSIYKD